MHVYKFTLAMTIPVKFTWPLNLSSLFVHLMLNSLTPCQINISYLINSPIFNIEASCSTKVYSVHQEYGYSLGLDHLLSHNGQRPCDQIENIVQEIQSQNINTEIDIKTWIYPQVQILNPTFFYIIVINSY